MFWKADGPIMTGTKGILARAVLQTPEGRRRYLERFVQLRTNVFNVEEVLMRVDQLVVRSQ